MQNNSNRIVDEDDTKALPSQTRLSLLKSMLRQIYNKDLPLDHIVFLYAGSAGILMAIFGLSYNLWMDLGVFTAPVFVIYLAVGISSMIYSIITKRWYKAAVIVVGGSAFVLIPFLWFTIGGMTGSSAPLVLTGGLCIALVFKGAMRTGMLVTQAIMLVAFIALEYHFPDIIIAYPNRELQYSDTAFSLTMCLLVNSILAYTVMAQYTRVQDERMRLVHRLEYLSHTDALTGLFNRRFLSASIDEEMRRAYDTGSPLTLCILDIDHFKAINDTYGHEYGDDVLINIAQIMKASLTEGEIFGRYGGEEFVVLLPGKTPTQALPTVRELCDRVRTHGWSHGKPVTLSGGLTCYIKGISYSDFVEAADKNLYRAKRAGRDRVIYR